MEDRLKVKCQISPLIEYCNKKNLSCQHSFPVYIYMNLCFVYFSDILQKEGLNADALYVRGMCLYYQDNIDKAFQHFQQVLRLAPDHQKAKDTYKVSETSCRFILAFTKQGQTDFKNVLGLHRNLLVCPKFLVSEVFTVPDNAILNKIRILQNHLCYIPYNAVKLLLIAVCLVYSKCKVMS